jgi:hypothetical protein
MPALVVLRVGLLVYVVRVALTTTEKDRRRTALVVLRILSPSLSVKLGTKLEITRGEAPGSR